MKTLILMLCVAIGFVLITDPRRELVPAQDEVQAEFQSKKPVDILMVDALNGMNEILGGVVTTLENQSREIASVEECVTGELAEVKSRLVAVETKQEEPPAPAPKAEIDGCNCGCDGKCAEKLADQERRLAAVEARVGMYPVVNSTTQSGGRLGSFGTPVEKPQVKRTPLVTAANVVTSPFRPGMTLEEKLDLHDALHEGDGIDRPGHWTFPGDIDAHLAGHVDNRVSAVRYAPQSQSARVRTAVSNCPGGNCPTSSRVSSSSNGWWVGKRLGVRWAK